MVAVDRLAGDIPLGRRLGVIGVLMRDDELLVVQRAMTVSKGGLWCFPGGRVEEGESSRNAVERELLEELSLEVAARDCVGRVTVPESEFVLDVWTVAHVSGKLRLLESEIADARWLTAVGIRALEQRLESNLGVLELLGI